MLILAATTIFSISCWCRSCTAGRAATTRVNYCQRNALRGIPGTQRRHSRTRRLPRPLNASTTAATVITTTTTAAATATAAVAVSPMAATVTICATAGAAAATAAVAAASMGARRVGVGAVAPLPRCDCDCDCGCVEQVVGVRPLQRQQRRWQREQGAGQLLVARSVEQAWAGSVVALATMRAQQAQQQQQAQ